MTPEPTCPISCGTVPGLFRPTPHARADRVHGAERLGGYRCRSMKTIRRNWRGACWSNGASSVARSRNGSRRTRKNPISSVQVRRTFGSRSRVLGQTLPQKKASELHSWFGKRRQIDRPGAYINASYAPDVTEKDAKKAVNLILRLLERGDCITYKHLAVTIPHDPDYKSDMDFSLCVNNQAILIISSRSMGGCYGCPYFGTKLRIDAEHYVKVREAGLERNATAGELGLDGQDLRLAILVTPWAHHEISLCGSIEFGDAQIGWPDRDRLLHDAQNAAKKFKDALEYRTAPSLIFYVSEYDSPQSCTIRIESLKAMLYGIPTLLWQAEGPENPKSSVIHGQGAFWANNKNTSVSAACYVSRSEPKCVLHNPWAKKSLPRGLIGCPEYQGLENGKIVRVR